MTSPSVKKLVILLLAVCPALFVRAQEQPPVQIMAALADLGTRLGTPLAIGNLDHWEWQQEVYGDASLGCPQPGVAYIQVLTSGYQFLLTYQGEIYDYRVPETGNRAILCSITEASGAVVTPQPAVPSGRQPPSATAELCPVPIPEGFLPPRLIAGAQGRVTEGGAANNVRVEPTVSSRTLGQIPPGAVFNVLTSPRCGDGLVWWQVEHNGLIGWTVEGQDGEYWVEPVLPTFTLPTDRPLITVTNAAQLETLAEVQYGMVDGVAWSPDGRLLAIASLDHVMLHDLSTPGSEPRVLQGHSNTIVSMAFSPDSRLLATGSVDLSVRLWDTATGEQHTPFASNQPAPVTSLAFSPNGRTLAGGGEGGLVWLWDVATGEARTLEGHTGSVSAVAFNPDGRLLASAGRSGLGVVDNSVRLWNLESSEQVQQFTGDADGVSAVAFSPDGTLLAFGGQGDFAAGEPGTVQVWDVINNTQTSAFQVTAGMVRSLSFSPDGTLLAIADSGGPSLAEASTGETMLLDGVVFLIDMATHVQLGAVPDLTGQVVDVAFSSDGTLLATVNTPYNEEGLLMPSSVRLWGVAS